MKAGRLSLLLLVAVAIGFTLGSDRSERKAVAQAPGVNPSSPGRYQISAWASQNGRIGGYEHGCYMVDTHTGRLWEEEMVEKKLVWEEKIEKLP